MKKKRRRARISYEGGLLERLKDPEYAAQYLMVCLESRERNVEELFLIALRDVAKANSFRSISKKTKLGRESLYKALSDKGNPTLSTLTSILNAMGLRISIEPRKAA